MNFGYTFGKFGRVLYSNFCFNRDLGHLMSLFRVLITLLRNKMNWELHFCYRVLSNDRVVLGFYGSTIFSAVIFTIVCLLLRFFIYLTNFH